jgi:hypothetical protein
MSSQTPVEAHTLAHLTRRLVGRIRWLHDHHVITYRELANGSRLSYTWLTRVMAGKGGSVSLEYFDAMMGALGWTVGDLSLPLHTHLKVWCGRRWENGLPVDTGVVEAQVEAQQYQD